MKALVYTKPNTIIYQEMPLPRIKFDEVLIKIKSVGICGTDLHIYSGGMKLPTPLIIGHEFSGVIWQIGSQVKKFKKGDRVVAEHVVSCGMCRYCLQGRPNLCSKAQVIGLHRSGALAQYVAVPASLVYPFPKSISFEEAALIEPLSIAYYAAQEIGFVLDKKVAVIGQGPIGLLVDQVLKAAGAHVIGIDIQDTRLQFATRQKWADKVINSKKQNVVDTIKAFTKEGVDITIEAVGQAATAEMSLEITRRHGTVVLLGVFESPANLNLMHLVKKELSMRGSWTCAFSFPQSIELVAQNKVDLKSLISHRYSAPEGARAFKEAFMYTEGRIKTIINF
ncbi:MAG: alcohol dehydrogenase catalytic domain-containing protein [Patescibacteria group bacterium]